MRIYLEVASQVLVLIFVLSTLFSVGLLVSARQVLAALQQRRSLAVALCANFVVLPGAALALGWALQLAPPMQAALLLVTTAPGSPVMLRLNEFARGDQAKAVGLLVLLTSLTMVYQPLVLPMLLPGLSVSPMPIARTLVLTVLLPLVLGLLLKARWPALAGRLRPALARLGNISAVLSCFILLPLVYLDALKDVALNGGGLLVLLLYLPLAVGAGWWLGGPDADQRRLLALCCGQGSMGAAFVIAAHNFNNPHVIAMLLLILWASLALLIPLALVFRRQSLGDVEDLSEKAVQRVRQRQAERGSARVAQEPRLSTTRGPASKCRLLRMWSAAIAPSATVKGWPTPVRASVGAPSWRGVGGGRRATLHTTSRMTPFPKVTPKRTFVAGAITGVEERGAGSSRGNWLRRSPEFPVNSKPDPVKLRVAPRLQT